MKNFLPAELAEANGATDSVTLVAVDGRVYDLSTSKKWVHGKHMNRHSAGKDLTSEITAAPHGKEVLERFPMIGEYQKSKPEAITGVPGIRGSIENWLQKHPFFRRHPHPAVVHIPIGLMITFPVFELAAFITRSAATEWSAYLCLIIGLISLPAAIVSGYFTWWINYDCKDSWIIRRKRRLAWFAFILALIATGWRSFFIDDPIMYSDLRVISYFLVTLALGVIITWIGFLGGKLTFPYEKQ